MNLKGISFYFELHNITMHKIFLNFTEMLTNKTKLEYTVVIYRHFNVG